jgi:hypothetical protein
MTFVKTLCRGWMAATLLSFALAAGAGAQPQNVAGARVTLQPPPGFTPAVRFPGFEHAASGSSILVTEVPGEAFAEMRDAFTARNLAARGMTLRTSETVRIDGYEGVLLAVSQEAHGIAFDKWVVAFGSDSATVAVTATYPAAAAAELGESLRQAVLSARMRGGPLDPFEGLTFRVAESARLKVAKRLVNMLILTETGDLSQGPSGAPFLIVGSSLVPGAMDDVEAFSGRRIGQTESIVGLGNLTGAPVTIDGIEGYELLADARDDASARPLRIYQVILPEGSHYLIIQGITGADRAAEMIPEFRAVARSLRRNR